MSFRKVANEFRIKASYVLLRLFRSLSMCFESYQRDLYYIFSRYCCELSLIVFGPTHPTTNLIKLVYDMSNEAELFEVVQRDRSNYQ